MCSVLSMVTTFLLSGMLVVGNLGGVVESDQKPVQTDRYLLSSFNGRHLKRGAVARDQVKVDTRKSLDMESLRIHTTPTSRRSSSPMITKLLQPEKANHKHANMPLRFGRQIDNEGKSTNPNMPQRFGRSWEVIRTCSKWPFLRVACVHGRIEEYWSLLYSLANAQTFISDVKYKTLK